MIYFKNNIYRFNDKNIFTMCIHNRSLKYFIYSIMYNKLCLQYIVCIINTVKHTYI